MHYLGYNYRITDIQCALGISQLKKLDSFLEKRQALVDFYNRELQYLDNIELPTTLPGITPAWHLYVIRLKGNRPPRREIFEELHRAGIGVQVHYLPVYWHPYYQKLGYTKGSCPVAEDYYWRALSLPLFPSLSKKDAKRVVSELKRVMDIFRETLEI
ncbi:MAG: DegT/DnrJ/EryC1/StrS family aminotransferase, partial [Eubacteriales bacterium]